MPRLHPSASVLLALLAACVDQPPTSPTESNRPNFAQVAVSSCDDLQAAFDVANEGDVITLAQGSVCFGHFDLPSAGITFQAEPAGATLDGTTEDGRVQILSGQNVGHTAIRYLTFRHGSTVGSGGAISLTGNSTPTLDNNIFIDNWADRDGGAVAIEDFFGSGGSAAAPEISLTSNVFGGAGGTNSAGQRGGAVYVHGMAGVALVNNTFTGNSAASGGALHLEAPAQVRDNVLSGNTAHTGGGAAFVSKFESVADASAPPDVQLSGNAWTGNSVTPGGCEGEECLVPAATGGAIYLDRLSAVLTGEVLTGNAADQGGGLYLGLGSAAVASNITLAGNTAVDEGGAVHTQAVSFRISASTLNGNTAGSKGGAIYFGFGLPDEVYGHQVSNSTASGNTAGEGGAFYVESEVSLLNVTVRANGATGAAGGGIYSNGGLPGIKNTLLSGNTVAGGAAGNCGGDTPSSDGHNLSDDGTCGLGGVGDQVGVSALLGPLADNGGPTRTHALLAGSPAIDAGDNVGCPLRDQRGEARPQGPACDIGSVEQKPATLAADITIVPGLPRVPIRLGDNNPAITVTVLTTATLNAGLIVPASLTLGNGQGTEAPVARYRGKPIVTVIDVDRDGDKDLIAAFNEPALVANGDLTTATSRLVLLGALTDGRKIRGEGAVKVVQ